MFADSGERWPPPSLSSSVAAYEDSDQALEQPSPNPLGSWRGWFGSDSSRTVRGFLSTGRLWTRIENLSPALSRIFRHCLACPTLRLLRRRGSASMDSEVVAVWGCHPLGAPAVFAFHACSVSGRQHHPAAVPSCRPGNLDPVCKAQRLL